MPNIDKIEYGSGGYVVTRGYYCPNLYETFTVGGCNRGKILKRLTKKSKVSYEFCYVDNAMTMVKEYHDDPYSKKIGGIEFIERQGDIELGLYFTVVDDKIEKLLLINLSQFGDDKLINNRAILLHNKWEFEYEKNVYEYNNNLLVGIRHVEYSHSGTLKLSRKIKIDFIHAPDGCPVQFIVDGNKEIINDITKVNHEYYRREVLPKMQRNKKGT